MAAGALDRRPNVRRFAFDTSVDWSISLDAGLGLEF